MNVLPSRELGTTLDNPRTAHDIVRDAKINEEIQKVHLYKGDGSQVEGYMGLTYGDHLTGIVSPKYPVIQVEESIDATLGDLIKSGKLLPQEAGILRKGKKIWLASRIDIPNIEIVPGDPVEPRIMSLFNNDGKGAWLHVLTTRRIGCENSYDIVVRNRDELSQSVRIVHKGSPLQKAKIDGQIFCQASESFIAWSRQAKELTEKGPDKEERRFYLNTLFPTKKDTKRDVARVTRESVNRLSVYGQGQRGSEIRGSYWALFNGVTEHLDHKKTYKNTQNATRAENRFENVYLKGNSSKKKEEAFNLALTMARGEEVLVEN